MTFASCPVVAVEKLADHPPCGHLWLMRLANGWTQIAFGYEIKVRAA